MPTRAALLASLAIAVLGQACDNCASTCHKIYDADQCALQPVVSSNATPEESLAECISDCQDALYNAGGTDGGGTTTTLDNTGDALEFMTCVDALPLENCGQNEARLQCPWIGW